MEAICIHQKCGMAAFYYDHVPHEGERLLAKHAEFPDGTKPINGTEVICGSCLEPLTEPPEVYPI